MDRLKTKQNINLDGLVKTEIHKSVSKKYYLAADLDFKEEFSNQSVSEVLNTVEQTLGYKPIFIKTRGGIHVLIELEKVVNKKTFYNGLATDLISFNLLVEMKNDHMVPIPGTYQGGFSPYFL